MRELEGLTTTVDVRDDEGKIVGRKEVVLYKTLLDLAHEEGLSRITPKILQVPTKENGERCIVFAEVVTEKGTFTGVGDAAPSNVDPIIAPHFIRAAATRAKARALRDALNIGIVTFEEIYGNGYGERDEHPDSDEKPSGDGESRKSKEREPSDGDIPLITESQRKYIFRLLADQGLEGNDALNYLLDECGVDKVNDIPRKQASDLIESLKEEY